MSVRLIRNFWTDLRWSGPYFQNIDVLGLGRLRTEIFGTVRQIHFPITDRTNKARTEVPDHGQIMDRVSAHSWFE